MSKSHSFQEKRFNKDLFVDGFPEQITCGGILFQKSLGNAGSGFCRKFPEKFDPVRVFFDDRFRIFQDGAHHNTAQPCQNFVKENFQILSCNAEVVNGCNHVPRNIQQKSLNQRIHISRSCQTEKRKSLLFCNACAAVVTCTEKGDHLIQK